MKNFFTSKLFIYILAGVILAGAVAGTVIGIVASKSNNSSNLTVYTSFYPLYDFTKKVGGDKVEVINLVGAGEEAHDYEPQTNQLAGMAEADLIVINGAGMETWTTDLSANLQQKILDTSLFVELLPSTHNDEEEEEEHDHGEYDPHIWLSVSNAKEQMRAIKNKLIELDEENAAYYQRNFNKYAILFDGLINQYDSLLTNLDITTIVVAHAAFNYMVHDYEIEQITLTGIYDDNEPSVDTLTDAIDAVRNSNIRVVFYQSFVNSSAIEIIANNVDREIEIMMLNTIEGLTTQQIEAGEDYLSLMAENLANLVYALINV